MHDRLRRRRITAAVSTIWLAGLLVVCGVGTAVAAVDSSRSHSSGATLAGKWSGKYSGAFSGTFTLHWKQTGSKLTGSITLSNPKGTYGITGSVRGSAIKFGAVGAGATYTGSLSKSGKSMSGSYKSPQGGGSWSARKLS
jgi:hypothetical protein